MDDAEWSHMQCFSMADLLPRKTHFLGVGENVPSVSMFNESLPHGYWVIWVTVRVMVQLGLGLDILDDQWTMHCHLHIIRVLQ